MSDEEIVQDAKSRRLIDISTGLIKAASNQKRHSTLLHHLGFFEKMIFSYKTDAETNHKDDVDSNAKLDVSTAVRDLEKQKTVLEADKSVTNESNSKLNNLKSCSRVQQAIIYLLLILVAILFWTCCTQLFDENGKVTIAVRGAALDLNGQPDSYSFGSYNRISLDLEFTNTYPSWQLVESVGLSFHTQDRQFRIFLGKGFMHGFRVYKGLNKKFSNNHFFLEKDLRTQWRNAGNMTIDASISGKHTIPNGTSVAFSTPITLDMSCEKCGRCLQKGVLYQKTDYIYTHYQGYHL